MSDALISEIASRVLFLPPTRRDAEVIGPMLTRAELSCTICNDIVTLSAELDRGAGVLLITDNTFSDPQIETLAGSLERQPAWSDVPAVVLCQPGAQSNQVSHCLQSMRNVTVLEK